ncbi:mechanosensitive ion channel protein [Alteromonas sediminis]|uniref:Mechanosensitive ion channel protein n=1 Tax=Alteromonas sediminis TaxID=2259342 RepID=A0A3N5Y0Q7_9ALTE|nr:mechanosensitive ion channel domain-containing protein [Alteromonas sediminis]RPJ66473.1 mechanosensitive ion channel protein [Alteromonas sediminis]
MSEQSISDWLAKVTEVMSKDLFTLFDYQFNLFELILVPVILLIGLYIIRLLGRFLAERLAGSGVNPDSVLLIRRVFYVIALLILFVTALEILNIPITAFAFLSGAVAIGVGFGAQNVINNFISGWILMWEKPIKIGDFLEVDDARGTVETINTRSTRIRRVDGVHLLVPNSKLLENTVVNWTHMDRKARTSVRIGVAYGSPCKKVAALIKQAVDDQSEIQHSPEPIVIFDDFGDNALIFEVYFWVNASVERDLRLIRSNVRFRIDELFAQHAIVIAFPQRDLHLDGKLEISRHRD